MIKLLKQYQVQTSPFNATKNWHLNNIDNDNLLLFESTGSDDGEPFALEFIDYGDGSGLPVDNSSCDIALEQQDNDLAIMREGLNVTGIVNPEIEPINSDGTYKRSIYHQVRTMFYNRYLDPSKVWGLENIDFGVSKTQRILADEFRLFDVPRNVYGDKVIPKSVTIVDDTQDNLYTITDDGNGNLFAGKNVFSHQQELGEYVNEFHANLTSSYCDYYWAFHEHINTDTASMQIAFFGGQLRSQLNTDTASLALSFLFGSTQLAPPLIDSPTLRLGFTSGSIRLAAIVDSSSFDFPSLTVNFSSGSLVTNVITDSSSVDFPTLTVNFSSGSLVTNVITDSSSLDFPRVTVNFSSGSIVTNTFPITMSFNSMQNTVGFVSGNLI